MLNFWENISNNNNSNGNINLFQLISFIKENKDKDINQVIQQAVNDGMINPNQLSNDNIKKILPQAQQLAKSLGLKF